MTNILDQVARTNSAALRSQFFPETPSEFLALRLAARLHDHAAVRHYVALSERYGDSRLLTAYRRVRSLMPLRLPTALTLSPPKRYIG